MRILSEEIIAHLWSKITKVTLAYMDRAGTTRQLVREVTDHGMAAAVLAYDSERRTLLFARQMRIAAYMAGYKQPMLEACAGLLDEDTPEDCALREAREELGYDLHDLEYLGPAFASPGALTECVHLFLGRYRPEDRRYAGGGLKREGEDIEIVEMGYDQAFALLEQRDIVDAKTIILLQHLKIREILAGIG